MKTWTKQSKDVASRHYNSRRNTIRNLVLRLLEANRAGLTMQEIRAKLAVEYGKAAAPATVTHHLWLLKGEGLIRKLDQRRPIRWVWDAEKLSPKEKVRQIFKHKAEALTAADVYCYVRNTWPDDKPIRLPTVTKRLDELVGERYLEKWHGKYRRATDPGKAEDVFA